MSFFLLGKGPDEELHLLSSKPSGTRKEALAELSRLTSEAGFAHWDAEVFVLDLEAGTPVLLVRPEGGPAAEPSREPSATAEPSSAEESSATEGPSSVEEPAVVIEPSEETEHDVDPALAAVLDDLSAEEEPEDVVAVEAPEPVFVESSEVEALDDAALEGPEEHEPIDAAYAEAVIEEAAQGEEGSLKAALARTAAHMEASGITAPESVGPAEGAPAEESPAEEPPAEEPPSDEPPAEEPPSDEPPAEEPPSDEPPAWPWATGGAESDSPAFMISALEEPGIDEGSLVRAPGDDDTMSVSRPVILGAYEDGPSMSEPVADASIPDAQSADVSPTPDAEATATDSSPNVDVAVEPDSGTSGDTSDFILDLEPLGGGQPEPAGYQASDAPREMTCNDCVYVETCPNKDQRDPSTCGSFQWK